jgi:hypothetical protein
VLVNILVTWNGSALAGPPPRLVASSPGSLSDIFKAVVIGERKNVRANAPRVRLAFRYFRENRLQMNTIDVIPAKIQENSETAIETIQSRNVGAVKMQSKEASRRTMFTINRTTTTTV